MTKHTTTTIDILQDKFTLFHDQLKEGYTNMYINWIFLSFVILYIVLYSVKTHWCRPMFWLFIFCTFSNEYSEYLYLQNNRYYSKTFIDTSFRLAASLFSVGVFYSLFQRLRTKLTTVHVNYILYALSHMLLGVFTVEFIALFQTLSTNSCEWFYPIISWSGVSLVLFGIVATIMLKVHSCRDWIKHKSFWLVISIWGLCTYYLEWYFDSHCANIFQSSNSTNLFSWFLVIVYIIWDKMTTKQ